MWQWVHHEVRLAEGPTVTDPLVCRVLAEEMAILRRRPDAGGRIDLAAQLLREVLEAPRPPAFLSVRAYAVLLGQQAASRSAPAA